MSNDENIRVVARFRPLSRDEADQGVRLATRFEGPKAVEINLVEEGIAHRFEFAKVYDIDAAQEDIYADVGEPVVKDILRGYNGTVFAYGQTGSGKTHTMSGNTQGLTMATAGAGDSPGVVSPASTALSPMGASNRSGVAALNNSSYAGGNASGAGIIPRAVRDLFRLIEASDVALTFQVTLTYVEIYMERIRDLLDPSKGMLALREDIPNRCFYVDGCTQRDVTSAEETLGLIELGGRFRAVAATKMNEVSSRSHSIVSLVVRTMDARNGEQRTGKLFLVDLAGSEKVGRTKAEGLQLEEAKLINKSLTTLGLVISILADRKPGQHVPYRDSKLTRLLQDSLGGNSRTSLVVCCAPGANNEMETISTLRFGARATNVKNRAVVNKEVTMEELKALLARAEEEIRRLTSSGGATSMAASATSAAGGAPSMRGSALTDTSMAARAVGGSAATTVSAGAGGDSDDFIPLDVSMQERHLAVRYEQLEKKYEADTAALRDQLEEQRQMELLLQAKLAAEEAANGSLYEEISAWQSAYNDAVSACDRWQKQWESQQASAKEQCSVVKACQDAVQARASELEELKGAVERAIMAAQQLEDRNSSNTTTASSSSSGGATGNSSGAATAGAAVGSGTDSTSASTTTTTVEDAGGAAAVNLRRAVAAEGRFADLERNWKEVVNELGALRLELQLAEKRLDIRNERIEHLKYALKLEKANLRDLHDARNAEKLRLTEDVRNARTESEYWQKECSRLKDALTLISEARSRFHIAHPVATAGGGAGQQHHLLGSGESPNRTSMRFLRPQRSIRGGGSPSMAGVSGGSLATSQDSSPTSGSVPTDAATAQPVTSLAQLDFTSVDRPAAPIHFATSGRDDATTSGPVTSGDPPSRQHVDPNTKAPALNAADF